MTTHVDGKDLKVGDHIRFLCQFYPIIRFDPYPNGGPTIDGKHHPGRLVVMKSSEGESPMTVLDDDWVEIAVEDTSPNNAHWAEFLDTLYSVAR